MLHESYSSGDLGYCEYVGRTTGITLSWKRFDGHSEVVEVDCYHNKCGMSEQCELYKRRPVGFRMPHQSGDTTK